MAKSTMRSLSALCLVLLVCVCGKVTAQTVDDSRVIQSGTVAVRTRVVMLSSQEFSDKIQLVMPGVLSDIPGCRMIGYCPELQMVAISVPASQTNTADVIRHKLQDMGFNAPIFEKAGDWNTLMAEFSCTRQ